MKIKNLGMVDYAPTFEAMKQFNDHRTPNTEDELWLVEHPPVFTQGLAGKPEHLLFSGSIPVVQIDRGGQITYHGPGQTVMYLLLDLRRAGIGIRALVSLIEESVIGYLQELGIRAQSRIDAPGVYVDGKKIASLGLRVRGGCTYHGVALNVDMDLEPFSRINPCGLVGMQMTQLRDLGVALDADAAGTALAARFQRIWLAKTASSL